MMSTSKELIGQTIEAFFLTNNGVHCILLDSGESILVSSYALISKGESSKLFREALKRVNVQLENLGLPYVANERKDDVDDQEI